MARVEEGSWNPVLNPGSEPVLKPVLNVENYFQKFAVY